jgi:hypothetical protein
MEHWRNNTGSGNRKYSEMNLSHCCFAHRKSHQEQAVIEPRRRDDTLQANRLSYVTALRNSKIK